MKANTHLNLPSVGRFQFFSLIELMVVILIIGLVVGLVGPALFDQFEKARQNTARNQILLLKECAKSYYLDMNEYPQSLEDLVRDPGGRKSWKGPYIEDGELPPDPWDNDYQYRNPGENGRPFDIYSYGKDNQFGGEGGDADIGTWKE